MQKLYKETVDGFEPVGMEFTGFPSNGLWLVEDGKQNCIIPMGEKTEFPDLILIDYLCFQEELMHKMQEEWNNKALSVSDISKLACNFFAKKAKEFQNLA